MSPKLDDPSTNAASHAESPPTPSVYWGVFFVAMSVLLLEVALTRVFAIQMWHHFAYMVVSLALLGFGASGSVLTGFGIGERRGTSGLLATFASLYGLALLAVFFIVTRIQVDSLEIWNEPKYIGSLLLIYVVLSIPFLLAGCAIGTTLSRHPKHVGKLYCWDLVGSAAGGALAPLALGEIGSVSTVMAAVALGLLGGAIYAIPLAKPRKLVHAALALAGGVVFALFANDTLEWRIPFAPHKGAKAQFDVEHDKTLHSSTAQVDVSEPFESSMVIGGQFGDVDWMTVPLRYVTQDGTAPTALHENAADIEAFKNLDDAQAGSAYHCFTTRKQRPEDVLVIGVGGGVDIMVALAHDAQRVKGVEINQAMIRMVTEEYADYIGKLFDDPRVTLVHGEGRSYLSRSEEQFDIIQLSGVDTYTALSTGAYTLSESYLYTVEAVKDLYRRLKPGGIVNYSRFFLSHPQRPRETIRLANIVRQALSELGIKEPWRHICVLQAHMAASTMIRKEPFTSEELASMRAWSEREGFMGLVFDPERSLDGPFEGGRPAAYHFEVSADNMLEQVGMRLKTARANPLIAAFEKKFTTALRMALDGKKKESERHFRAWVDSLPNQSSVERSRLLMAFLKERDDFLELRQAHNTSFARAQEDFTRLLKSDDAARAEFVDNHLFDLDPSRDDKPFFFNYFKVSRLNDYLEGKGSWAAEYHPEFPVGHMVLIISMVQIGILAFLFIILPLWPLKKRKAKTPQRLRTFIYFAALGMGFMFVEIGLMQRFILFLGHPTYSLAVVLSGMLAFSGLGALLSSRIANPNRATMTRLLIVIIAMIVVEILAVNFVLPSLRSLPLFGRICATLVALAPLGIALGMPFPLGIRRLEKSAPALIPWGWAVNGFLSVFSSIMVTLLAMATGFTIVIGLAAIIYAIGFYFGPKDLDTATA